MSNAVAEPQINSQLLLVRVLMHRYRVEIHLAKYKQVAPQANLASIRVLEELTVPAEAWLAQANREELELEFIHALSGQFHNEGQEHIYFLHVLANASQEENFDILLSRFVETLRRNPYPISESEEDTRDREFLLGFLAIYSQMRVHTSVEMPW